MFFNHNIKNIISKYLYYYISEKIIKFLIFYSKIKKIINKLRNLAIKYIFGLDQFDNDFERTLHLIELAKEDFEGFQATAADGLTAEAILDGHNQCLDGAEMASMIPYLPDAMSEELNGSSDLVQSLIYLYTRTMMADGLVSHSL